MASSFLTCFFILFLLYISIFISFALPPVGIRLPLIHRCSLPEYSKETFKNLVETSSKLLTLRFQVRYEAKFYVNIPMIQFTSSLAVYYLNVTIGNPPVPQYMHVDTGSSLTWVSQKSTPPKQYFYDPGASSTFKYIGCGDPICSSKNGFNCLGLKINRCGYKVEYLDGSEVTGIIGYDQFGFVNLQDRGNPYVQHNVLFGALGNLVNDPAPNDPQYYGIFGLGPESISLVNHLPKPKVFHYCVANLGIPEKSQGYLHFGELDSDYDTIPTTPMIKGYDHYIVEIESICLFNACLAIDPSVFKHVEGNYDTGVQLDTGSVLSLLPDVAYDALVEAIKKIMASKKKTEFPHESYLCYKGDLNDEVKQHYPDLSIQFVKGRATMLISHMEYFFELFPNVYCLSFKKASSIHENLKNFTLIGLQSQQYHLYEYNLDSWTLGILVDMNCDDPLV